MPKTATDGNRGGHDPPLAMFACPNPDCDRFNHFNAGNLSVCERMGKGQAIRRLYCNHCGHRFSERQGSLMQYTKLPTATVVRIIKCLGHGCSIEAAADICEVDPRTVQRLLERAGKRAEDFHELVEHLLSLGLAESGAVLKGVDHPADEVGTAYPVVERGRQLRDREREGAGHADQHVLAEAMQVERRR